MFTQAGKNAYVVNELDSSVTVTSKMLNTGRSNFRKSSPHCERTSHVIYFPDRHGYAGLITPSSLCLPLITITNPIA
ncbi:hypothetical protein [Pseudomonas sp. FP2309]|uniref:hypothetical protein n=1 Tax=Pseudomonas sp. FP2309 TaxID=2954091 RepID=UPI002735757E|nr:hypothetical protein [Pseudomonas sp. FP2309]WLH66157.1 hypothetical protein PSH59_13420 [Pseudomonas sp. FP2309]